MPIYYSYLILYNDLYFNFIGYVSVTSALRSGQTSTPSDEETRRVCTLK